MVSAGAVVLGFIILMGLFTFGSGDGKDYRIQMVEVEKEEIEQTQK